MSGEVRAFAGDALSQQERAERQVLYCQTRPRSDLEIAPKLIEKADPFARKKLKARVFRMKQLADDVMLVHLRYPAGERVRFKAGQYVSILWGDGRNRDFSMANPPRESDGVQLHVRLVKDGAFTEHVFGTMKVGDQIDVEVPFGSFTLRESDKPILFVAGGTGFAPIQAMIEDMAINGIQRDMTLYWGARQRSGLYSDMPERWAQSNPRFRYIPVLSDVPEDGFPQRLRAPGRSGGSSLAGGFPGLRLRRAGAVPRRAQGLPRRRPAGARVLYRHVHHPGRHRCGAAGLRHRQFRGPAGTRMTAICLKFSAF